MRNLLTKFVKVGIFLFLLLAYVDSNAQLRYAPVAGSNIRYTIENDVQTSTKILEFDLYLKALNPSPDSIFELSSVQAGVYVTKAISAGTMTATYTASGLPTAMRGTITYATGTPQGCIKIAAKAGPGCGLGQTISKDEPGTLLYHVKLTSTTDFVAGSQANLYFSFTTVPYKTAAWQYYVPYPSPCAQLVVPCDATNCYPGANYHNIVLNAPAPTTFSVIGTGQYCDGGPIALSGSQLNVVYTVLQDGNPQTPTVNGTGAELSLGVWPANHTYTVTAKYYGSYYTIQTPMTGSAVLSYFLNPTWKGTGTNPTDWTATDNWCGGNLPLSSDNAIIPPSLTNYPVISTADSCYDLTIQDGAKVTINPTGSLTLTNILYLAGTEALIIKSDATGTGALIDINGIEGTGTAKVQRYLTGYSTHFDHKYHFLSSPVENQAIKPEFVYLPNSVNDFYRFSEQYNSWVNTKRLPDTLWNEGFGDNLFHLGAGYLVSYKFDTTKNFIGPLHTTPFSSPAIVIPCSYTAGSSEGWNLIGNPYPSSLDWDLVNAGTTGLDAALYVYTCADTNYKYYLPLEGGGSLGTGSKYLPAMQGFFVRAQSGSGAVTLTNSMRTVLGMDVYNKNTSADLSNYLILTVNGTNSSDRAFVYFTNKATQDFDGKFDAHKLMSMESMVPMIYTITPDESYLAINSLPPSATSRALPLAFKAGIDGSYTINASNLNSFLSDVSIVLEDLKTGASQNLKQNPVYSFNGSTTDITNRFLLHFTGTIGIPDQIVISPVKIYSSDKTVYISCSSGLLNAQVIITDLVGKQILTKNLDNQVLNKIQLDVVEGYYIVKVQTAQTVKTVKVFIK
jgi:hypothetical protein